MLVSGKRRGDSSPIAISSDDEADDSNGHSDDVEFVNNDLIPGARPKAGSGDSDASEDSEEAFIVQDDDAPDSYQLPAEFSMDSHQDLMHHFKIVCQLFVHAALSDDREMFMHGAMSECYFCFLGCILASSTTDIALENQYFSVPLQVGSLQESASSRSSTDICRYRLRVRSSSVSGIRLLRPRCGRTPSSARYSSTPICHRMTSNSHFQVVTHAIWAGANPQSLCS
jgi:hypothetical protein